MWSCPLLPDQEHAAKRIEKKPKSYTFEQVAARDAAASDQVDLGLARKQVKEASVVRAGGKQAIKKGDFLEPAGALSNICPGPLLFFGKFTYLLTHKSEGTHCYWLIKSILARGKHGPEA